MQRRQQCWERREEIGNLKVTSTELASDTDVKGSLHQTRVTKAQEFEAETKSHYEELKTRAQAKQGI